MAASWFSPKDGSCAPAQPSTGAGRGGSAVPAADREGVPQFLPGRACPFSWFAMRVACVAAARASALIAWSACIASVACGLQPGERFGRAGAESGTSADPRSRRRRRARPGPCAHTARESALRQLFSALVEDGKPSLAASWEAVLDPIDGTDTTSTSSRSTWDRRASPTARRSAPTRSLVVATALCARRRAPPTFAPLSDHRKRRRARAGGCCASLSRCAGVRRRTRCSATARPTPSTNDEIPRGHHRQRRRQQRAPRLLRSRSAAAYVGRRHLARAGDVVPTETAVVIGATRRVTRLACARACERDDVRVRAPGGASVGARQRSRGARAARRHRRRRRSRGPGRRRGRRPCARVPTTARPPASRLSATISRGDSITNPITAVSST